MKILLVDGTNVTALRRDVPIEPINPSACRVPGFKIMEPTT